MPKFTKLTKLEFDAREAEMCTDAGDRPFVKVYPGNLPVKLTFKDYDLPIEAGTYKWLVFVPCELIGEFNWIRSFSSPFATALKPDGKGNYTISPFGDRKPRRANGEYKSIELENNGVLFAFS